MSSTTLHDLRHSVIGQWHSRLAGNTSSRRNHWRTKTVYFRSVTELLAETPRTPTWHKIVATARPHGCRSTFYEVAGAHARHRMIDALIGDGRPDSYQIALRYLRTDPVEQLIDEAKIWSYWPFRQQLLTRLPPDRPGPVMEEALVHSVRAWERQHESLAAALEHSPPACAVEDLTIIHHGLLAATRAADRLSIMLDHATDAR